LAAKAYVMRCSPHRLNTADADHLSSNPHLQSELQQLLPLAATKIPMSDRREVARGVNILILGERWSVADDWVLNRFTEDSGGASGLSSLMILAESMNRLQSAAGLTGPADIHDHFDIVAGTGTGA
jgi:hypothetical protein